MCRRGVKTARHKPDHAAAEKLSGGPSKTRLGQRSRIVVDGPASDHDLVLRTPGGQAPDIDASVYLTECTVPSAYRAGDFVDVEIVGAQSTTCSCGR